MLAKIKRGLVVGGVTGVLVMLAYLLNAITGFDIFQIVSNFVTNTGWNASYQGGLLVREFHVDIYRDELQSLKDHPFLLVYDSEDIYHLNYSAACWEYSYNGKVPGIRGEVRMSKLWLP